MRTARRTTDSAVTLCAPFPAVPFHPLVKMNARNDELLQPTLAADLDVRGFGRLFKPQSILWPTFFGGPIAGGILFGMNYARMGRRDLAVRCWTAAAVVGVLFAIGVGLYFSQPGALGGDSDARGTTRVMRYVIMGASVGMGWFVAKHQEPRFTAWESASNAPAKLLGPGLLAVIVGALVLGAVIVATLALRGVL